MIVGSGISGICCSYFYFVITAFIRRVILGGGPGEETLFSVICTA